MVKKKIIKKLLVASFAVGSFSFIPEIYHFPQISSVAYAEVKEYIGVGEAIISDNENLNIGKEGAKLQAIRNAQEQTGVFISNITEVRNAILQKDEIVAFTAGIAKINGDIKYEPISLGDALGTMKYRATVIAQIDTNDLNNKIMEWKNKNHSEQTNLVNQNKLLLENIEELKRRNAELENQLKTTQNTTKIKEETEKSKNATQFTQKLYDGYKSYYTEDYKNAAKNYSEALKIKEFEYEFKSSVDVPKIHNDVASKIMARIAAIKIVQRDIAEYLNKFVSDRGINSNDQNIKILIDQIVKNSKCIKESFAENGEKEYAI